MTNPSRVIREIAASWDKLSPEDRRELWERLASDFAAQHNNQNNQWAIALGLAENNWRDDLEALARELRGGLAELHQALDAHTGVSSTERGDIRAHLATVEERQNKILEMLETLQCELRAVGERREGD